jgi:hypothetical protein
VNVTHFESKGLVFPGRAGQLQRDGAFPSLLAELGANYPTYHAFLKEEAAKLGRPRPADYENLQSYLDAYAKAQAIVLAEVLLRNCRGHRSRGRAIDTALDTSVPLVDPSDRLVGLDD